MSNEHEFLDIPCDEHIVPFPNTAAVIMQHAREFPERTAFQFPDSSYTYSELLGICRNISLPENTGIVLSFKDIQNSLMLMLALLYRGIPFHLDLGKNTNYRFPGFLLTIPQMRKFPSSNLTTGRLR
ncbi:MAG: hypothetical protein U5N56_00490 [Candidatus Marinimicrobia bacterium]|nr:hypothetical protein [Candidatus Neomarinimicrobiota bacterium]